MNVVHFIYLLTFANGKVYVGMSRTDRKGLFTGRYRDHARTARSGKLLPVYNAWRKHGAPVQTILSTHETRGAAALAEIDAIQAHDSMNSACGYNLMPGGQGMHAPAGSAIYELMRAKVWNNPVWRQKLSDAFKGKPVSDETRAAHEVWRKTPEAKAQFSEIAKRPERRAKLSAIMNRRLETGYREYLSEVQVGKPRNHSAEGKAHIAAGRAKWLASAEGKAASRRGWDTMRSVPANEAKRKAAALAASQSDANKQHCAQMGAKARKPVREVATGRVFESLRAAAAAFGVTGPTVSYWLKRGTFEYV